MKRMKKRNEEIVEELKELLIETIDELTSDDVPTDIIEDAVEEAVDAIDEDTDIIDTIDSEEERNEEDDTDDVIEDEERDSEEEVIVDEEPIAEAGNIIEGYGIVFNEMSEELFDDYYGYFREIIEPEAVTEELINSSDIYYLYNHNGESMPLARSNGGEGSLQLTIDEKGLQYSFECNDEKFYNSVKRGDLNKSSFAFTLPTDGSGERWEKSDEYGYIRYITKIEALHDISAVMTPAYSTTELSARNKKSHNIKKVDSTYYRSYDNVIKQLMR